MIALGGEIFGQTVMLVRLDMLYHDLSLMTRTGAAISALAAPKFKKLSLELGGKNATVVFDDCDFDEAVSTAVRAAFSNQGQICLCGSRILIQEALYDRFRDAMVAKVSKMRIGDPKIALAHATDP